jgi:hypothetical protein
MMVHAELSAAAGVAVITGMMSADEAANAAAVRSLGIRTSR